MKLVEIRRKIDRKRNPGDFKKMSKKIKTRVKKLRERHLGTVAATINLTWRMRELEKMYAETKTDGYGFDSKVDGRCTDSELSEHFKKQFNKLNTNDPPEELTTNIPNCISELGRLQFDTRNLTDNPPTTDELITAITKLKNGKSSTDAPGECLKALVENTVFLEVVQRAVAKIWETMDVPEQWRVSRITALFKKGDTSVAENYRGLSVSAVMLKAVMTVIQDRQRCWYEATLDDCQNGFRSDRGTIDSIMIVKGVARAAKAAKCQVFCLALDLKSAYDWIKREWIWLNMDARNVEAEYKQELTNLYRLIRELYSETYAHLGDESAKFETISGVLQGAVESPAIFAIFFDTILRIFMDKCQKNGVSGVKFDYRIPAAASTRAQRVAGRLNGSREVFYAGFADDVYITCKSLEDLIAASAIMTDICDRFGLTICTKKTKSMIINWEEPVPETTETPQNPTKSKKSSKTTKKATKYPKTLVTINGIPIDNVSVFKYLGVKIGHMDYRTGQSEISYRISTANHKFREMKHIFSNKNISMKVRIIFYNAFVRTRLTYGCQLWNLPKTLRDKIENTQNMHLRQLVKRGFERKGGPRSNQDNIGYNWAPVISNKKLLGICRTDPVLNFADFQRAKWFSHVIRKDNDAVVKQVLFEETQSTRKGRTTSALDQLLEVTRHHDMSDNEVYKSSVSRDFLTVLDDRDVKFIPKHHGDYEADLLQ